MRRWPRERKSDNPFLVFCFILPELPLKKIAIIRKFMKDTQLRCILYVVTMVQGVWLKKS